MYSDTFDWDIFASILFLNGHTADGMLTTLKLSLVVWMIALIFGWLMSEAKFHITPSCRWIIDFILWPCKCIPILVLIYYFYYARMFSGFLASVIGMSFWAIAYSTERFYCCRLYFEEYKKNDKTSSCSLILIPISLKILTGIVALSPLMSFMGVPDFFSMAYRQISMTDQPKEILLAAMAVYAIVVGFISIIAKMLDVLFKTPELLR